MCLLASKDKSRRIWSDRWTVREGISNHKPNCSATVLLRLILTENKKTQPIEPELYSHGAKMYALADC